MRKQIIKTLEDAVNFRVAIAINKQNAHLLNAANSDLMVYFF